MTTTLNSSLAAQLGWTWRDRVGSLVVVDSNRLEGRRELDDGEGSGEANAVWHAVDQTLSAGQATVLELDALVQELFGASILVSLAKVKTLLIVNKNAAGPGYLAVGGAEEDAWTGPFGDAADTIKVMPGGPLLVADVLDGFAVSAGGHALRIAAVGDDVTFDIAILGVLAESGSSSG